MSMGRPGIVLAPVPTACLSSAVSGGLYTKSYTTVSLGISTTSSGEGASDSTPMPMELQFTTRCGVAKVLLIVSFSQAFADSLLLGYVPVRSAERASAAPILLFNIVKERTLLSNKAQV